jgi:hypothetical protein
MDEETFEQAKENDLSLDEAEELQDFKDETGLEGDVPARKVLAENGG